MEDLLQSQLDKPIQLTHLTKAISLITNLYLRAHNLLKIGIEG